MNKQLQTGPIQVTQRQVQVDPDEDLAICETCEGPIVSFQGLCVPPQMIVGDRGQAQELVPYPIFVCLDCHKLYKLPLKSRKEVRASRGVQGESS